MSTTIELPDGLGTAILRDPATITERTRRPLLRAQIKVAGSAVGQLLAAKASLADDDTAGAETINAEFGKLIATDDNAAALLDNLNDAMVVALVEQFDGQPVTVDNVLDIPGRKLDALRTAVAPYLVELMPSFSPTADESSPTPPSDN